MVRYGAEPSEQQKIGTAGIEGVDWLIDTFRQVRYYTKSDQSSKLNSKSMRNAHGFFFNFPRPCFRPSYCRGGSAVQPPRRSAPVFLCGVFGPPVSRKNLMPTISCSPTSLVASVQHKWHDIIFRLFAVKHLMNLRKSQFTSMDFVIPLVHWGKFLILNLKIL